MRTAVIIGGGRGIGAAVCSQLVASNRHAVQHLLIAQRSQPDPKLLEELRRGGTEISFLPLDIADRHSRENFCRSAPDRIDYLVHCAGNCPRESFLDMTEEIWDEVVSVNLKGPLFLTQALYPKLQKADRSSVCFVTSLAGRFGGRGSSVAYTASKAGLDAAMKALAKLGVGKVSCFSVAPGPTNTDMMREVSPQEMGKIKAATITGEICQPEEVAQLIVDCLGRLGQTGQVIDINHGIFIP